MSYFKAAKNFAHSKKIATLTLSVMACSVATLSHAEFEAGKDYKVLSTPEKIEGKQVLVREFFWYGCPHCYHLNKHANKWKKTQAKDVTFFETPAALNSSWEKSARGFYAAQALGIQKKSHNDLFAAIHEGNKQIFDQYSLANFYAKYGADKNKFNNLYNSFNVTTKVNRAKKASIRYGLSGVPAVVVHGKYVVNGSNEKTFKVVDYLINKVRKESVLAK